jgi:hypothetical protein
VLIEDGVYRETVKIEASGTEAAPIRFMAAPGANVVVTGADVLSDWQREPGEPNLYSAPWTHVFIGWSKTRTHPADDYHLMIGRAEQVFVERYSLLQVPSRAELARGTFWVDEPGQKLYLWDRANRDLAKARLTVEASTRTILWDCVGAWVQTRGIRFRWAANQNQSAAVILRGTGSLVEDCVIEQMNSVGLALAGDRLVARRCVVRDNGQMGFSAHGNDLLITGCTCENNNTRNVARGWEAGGNKLVLCRNAVIEKSIFRDNRGNGIWFDIGNEDCEVRNCLISNNEDAGIFYEISYRLYAHDNVLVGNGLGSGFGAWGANGGISLSSSSGCRIERNLLVANKEGFQFREQGRTTPRIGRSGDEVAIWNHDHTIRHNLIAFNRDLQTGGWFDVLDGSYWPRAQQEPRPDGAAVPPLPAGDWDGLKQRPAGLALEDLKLTFEQNLYAIKPGQALVQWGCSWRKHATYATLDEVRTTLGFEAGSTVAAVEFQDWVRLDLRLPADSPVLKTGCYPQGEVPGVTLGTQSPPGR